MKIVIRPEQSIEVDTIVIEKIEDSFEEFKIIAHLKDVPRRLILWAGETEYNEAGAWTNQSATDRVNEILNSGNPTWEH